MKFTLNKIKENLLDSTMSENEITSLIGDISKGFTSSRDKIGEYVLDKKKVSAYSCFYFPTNIPKFRFLFDHLPSEAKESISRSTFIDIGTGPGTFVSAFLDYFPESNNALYGTDTSSMMLKQASMLVKAFFPEREKVHFQKEIPYIEGAKTVLFGHSLNEMGSAGALKLIRELDADFIIFIEPGTTSVFNEMMKIRKSLAFEKFDCIYPCANIESPCPIVQKKKMGVEDWCHQVIRMTHNQDIERLSQLVSLDRKTMPVICHVYSRNKLNSPSKARFVRFFRETKFCFEWEVCREVDGKLVTNRFEVMKKSMSKSDVKTLKKVSVGIDVEFEILKKVSEDHYRVKLLF